MSDQQFITGLIPERFVEVDAARLLLILARFSLPFDSGSDDLTYLPAHPFSAHFTPEYRLHKIDFLLRYPAYFVYELAELHRMRVPAAADADEVTGVINSVLEVREPELLTLPFRRFWRGAYERIDDVEAWWFSRDLVYTTFELRGYARPQKHFFITQEGLAQAGRLATEVPHAEWYAERVGLIHRFFGSLSAAELKDLQYRHPAYRQAQLDEVIPDLTANEIQENFADVFGEPLGVPLE